MAELRYADSATCIGCPAPREIGAGPCCNPTKGIAMNSLEAERLILNEQARLEAEKPDTAPFGGWYSTAVGNVAALLDENPYALHRLASGDTDVPESLKRLQIVIENDSAAKPNRHQYVRPIGPITSFEHQLNEQQAQWACLLSCEND